MQNENTEVEQRIREKWSGEMIKRVLSDVPYCC